MDHLGKGLTKYHTEKDSWLIAQTYSWLIAQTYSPLGAQQYTMLLLLKF